MLITRLAALAEAVADLRAAQQCAAQASAAIAAARQLHATRAASAAQPSAPDRVSTTANLAELSVPPALPGHGKPQARPPAARGPSPPRP